MDNSAYVLWLERIDPERLSQIPAITVLATHGATADLTPQPLADPRNCYFQTLAGVGSGKTGRFDSVRPVQYQAHREEETPEGVWNRLLPDLLRANGATSTFREIDVKDAPQALAHEPADCTILRIRDADHANLDSLDALVSQCATQAGPTGHIIVVSDVLNQTPTHLVNTNDFLATIGLLDKRELPDGTSDIIWSQTLAYGVGLGQIWINVSGREPQGIVAPGREYDDVCDALIDALCNDWRDPATREPVVERALQKDHAYVGEYLFKAPDIVITWRPGYAPSLRAAAAGLDGNSIQPTGQPAAEPARAPYARLIAHGLACAPGGAATGKLVDVVPTVLYLLGQTIPAHLDGAVLDDLFSPDYRGHTPHVHAQDTPSVLSVEEERVIVDRLAALGYLG